VTDVPQYIKDRWDARNKEITERMEQSYREEMPARPTQEEIDDTNDRFTVLEQSDFQYMRSWLRTGTDEVPVTVVAVQEQADDGDDYIVPLFIAINESVLDRLSPPEGVEVQGQRQETDDG
jgi:hypothetical protein